MINYTTITIISLVQQIFLELTALNCELAFVNEMNNSYDK
jgi:hypothetical protein